VFYVFVEFIYLCSLLIKNYFILVFLVVFFEKNARIRQKMKKNL